MLRLLLCLLGWHRWYVPPYGRRSCVGCGREQEARRDGSGWTDRR